METRVVQVVRSVHTCETVGQTLFLCPAVEKPRTCISGQQHWQFGLSARNIPHSGVAAASVRRLPSAGRESPSNERGEPKD